jgi:protocatechuate 3,4-dioxygenase beta subunit
MQSAWFRQIAMAAVVIGAASAGASAGEDRSMQSFRCTGEVIGPDGEPLTGADVWMYEGHWECGKATPIWELRGRTRTDGKARFSMESRVGNRQDVRVVALKPGFGLGQWRNWTSGPGTDITVRLGRPATLGGRVVDDTNRPIQGARLRIRSSAIEEGLPEPTACVSASTDEQGRFSFSNLPKGEIVDVWVEAAGKAGYWTSWATAMRAGRQFQTGQTNIELVLQPEARVQGQVVDEASGRGVKGVILVARSDRPHVGPCDNFRTVSGEDGRFDLVGLAGDDYSLQVMVSSDASSEWVARDVKVSASCAKTTEAVRVPVSHGIAVEVVVRDALTAKPIEGACVWLDQQATFGEIPCYARMVRTDGSGLAGFRVPGGYCEIRADGEDYQVYRDSDPFLVAQEGAQRRDIDLLPCPVVEGIVTGPSDRPAAGVQVTVVPRDGPSCLTDSKGRFRCNPRSTTGPSGLMLVLARDPVDGLADVVAFRSVPASIAVRLKPAFTLRGRVTDPNGKAVRRAEVGLVGHLDSYGVSIASPAVTDANGWYEIRAVPPPWYDFTYSREVSAPGYGPVTAGQAARPDANNPDRVVLLDPVVLQPADRSVSGIVMDTAGRPVPGVEINVDGRGQPRCRAVTDEQGRFLVEGLCEGLVHVDAFRQGPPRGEGRSEVRSGDRDVRVVMHDEKHVPSMSFRGDRAVYGSLKGSELPDLNDLCTTLPVAELKDKPILLCLVDIDEDPASRQCLKDLGKMAETLTGQAVAVVVVQIPGVNPVRYSDWLEDNHITFRIYGGQRTFEGKKVEWGVNSLPWLILTNREHVVVADGLSVSGLGAVLHRAR